MPEICRHLHRKVLGDRTDITTHPLQNLGVERTRTLEWLSSNICPMLLERNFIGQNWLFFAFFVLFAAIGILELRVKTGWKGYRDEN